MNTAIILRGTIFPAWEIRTSPLMGLYGQAVDKAMTWPRPGLATYAFSGKPLPCCTEFRVDHLLLTGYRDGCLLLK